MPLPRLTSPPLDCPLLPCGVPVAVREAFFLAASGRPGPVLVDIPKDIQQQLAVPDWTQPMKLNAYLSRMPPAPQRPQVGPGAAQPAELC